MIEDVETEELPRPTCLELLGSRSLGRIAFSRRALPAVVPVTYRLVGDRLVFFSPSEAGLLTGGRNSVVAFEVDDVDPDTFAGWSVVVIGVIEEQQSVEVEEALEPHETVALATGHLCGRRFKAVGLRGER